MQGARRQGLNPQQLVAAKSMFASGRSLKEVADHFHVAESGIAHLAPKKEVKKPVAKKAAAKKKAPRAAAKRKTARAGTPNGKSN